MFVKRVLHSCKTVDQLSMAEKMIWQYPTMVSLTDPTSAEDLYAVYENKQQELFGTMYNKVLIFDTNE